VACPIRLSATPVVYRQAPPRLGEDTEALLRALGRDEATIAALRREGVV
jgi:crotonobetainyl-CoA:carnitine CoA-transferase CaiB-like acyl-CoA transferase